MNVHLREATPDDAATCGRILYDAFKGIADYHRFPPEYASVRASTALAGFFIRHAAVFSVVAERDGRVIGVNFLDERDAVRGLGPVAVDPHSQERGIGRRLMQAVIERGVSASGIRLTQDAYNTLAMSLYAALDFEVQEPLVSLKGKPAGRPRRDVEVRPLTANDLDACAALCTRVHGSPRTGEMRDAVQYSACFGVVRDGRLVAYTYSYTAKSAEWILAHGVAETEADMQALLLAVGEVSGRPLAFLVPTRQAALFRWCLAEGLRVAKPGSLMTRGAYREPRGCWFPSGLY